MKSQEPSDSQAVADLWGQTAKARAHSHVRGWLDHPLVLREYVQPKQTGHPDTNWLPALVARAGVPSGGRWLSIGCGAAGTEIAFADAGLWAEMDAYDLSPGAIEQARKAAADRGVANIRFDVRGFDDLHVKPASFDVVLMIMSLHHALDLDAALGRVSAALRTGGFLLVNEFVGPQRFQFTDLQVGIVSELLAALPERLRADCATGQLRSSYQRMPIEHWLRADPSEAAQSSKIPSALCRHFELVARIDYGGTLLSLLLEHIIHNFDAANTDNVAFVRLLAKTEDLLIRHGVLPSDFTLMAMRKPDAPRRRLALWLKRLPASN